MYRQNNGNSKMVWWVIMICLAIFILSGIVRSHMMSAINSRLILIEKKFVTFENDYESLKKSYEIAKKNHLPSYLRDFEETILQVKKHSLIARRNLELAKKASDPKSKLKFADETSREVQIVFGSTNRQLYYLKFLDEAKAEYRKKPSEVDGEIKTAERIISNYQLAGYFPTHFVNASCLISSSKNRLETAVSLIDKVYENNQPDYKQIFELELEALDMARNAQSSAKQVIALQGQNNQLISEISATLKNLEALYLKAYDCGVKLQPYGKYHRLDLVKNTKTSLGQISAICRLAEKYNSMDFQRFNEASEELSKALSIITNASSIYNDCIATWHKVDSAIRNLESAKRNARDRMDEAESRISSYSYNYQGSAESKLETARKYQSEGISYSQSDPPLALESYEQAYQEADDAYYSVNTSSRHSSSSDDDSSSSGSSSWDSGSGSSNWDSGGSGSSSWDSSPSGSYDSGPSGSYDSGPSGSYDGGGI